MSDLPFHQLANLFPLIEGDAFESLVADIRAHGVREPVTLLDGSILDGRNRYRAAQIAGRDVTLLPFDPLKDGDPLTFVVSKNLARRHLNDDQRRMVAARIANMGRGRPSSKIAGENPAECGIKVADAAKITSVDPAGTERARRVIDQGTPELNAAVDRGRLSVAAASQAVKLSPTQQNLVAREAEAGRKATAQTILKQETRRNHEVDLAKKQLALPDKKFGVILADPEWEFVTFSKVTGQDRSPSNHYATSGEKEISARDVQKLAAKDCLLALWVTDLARGLRVLEMWGFEFKSYFVWVKDIVAYPFVDSEARTFEEIGPAGLGYWNRDRDEILLIGTRGEIPCPAPGTQGESVWFAARPKIEGTQRGKHSAKPQDAHLWIEKHFPHLPKIELNARAKRDGWEVWGADVAGEARP
jgi:N6-adenosine-specific RNA methylase IME4